MYKLSACLCYLASDRNSLPSFLSPCIFRAGDRPFNAGLVRPTYTSHMFIVRSGALCSWRCCSTWCTSRCTSSCKVVARRLIAGTVSFHRIAHFKFYNAVAWWNISSLPRCFSKEFQHCSESSEPLLRSKLEQTRKTPPIAVYLVQHNQTDTVHKSGCKRFGSYMRTHVFFSFSFLKFQLNEVMFKIIFFHLFLNIFFHDSEYIMDRWKKHAGRESMETYPEFFATQAFCKNDLTAFTLLFLSVS